MKMMFHYEGASVGRRLSINPAKYLPAINHQIRFIGLAIILVLGLVAGSNQFTGSVPVTDPFLFLFQSIAR